MAETRRDTIAALVPKINRAWGETIRHKIDWLAFEELMVEILDSEGLTSDDKVFAAKECVDAFTHRGHFIGEAYFTERAQ